MIHGMSFWTLEDCTTCKGTGVLGCFQDNAIYCEDCYGSGYEWSEHLFIGD